MIDNPNVSFDRPKLTLTCLEQIDPADFDQVSSKLGEQIKYVMMRFKVKKENSLPYDKENIILPRQQTFVQKVKDSRFPKQKKNRMIWDETKKVWILRRHKQKAVAIPPVIEATKEDAYEDVFRKREMEQELKKAQKQLRKTKKDTIKQKKISKIRKQL